MFSRDRLPGIFGGQGINRALALLAEPIPQGEFDLARVRHGPRCDAN